MSRRPDWQEGIDNDNKDRTLIKPEWVQKKVRREKETLIEKENIKEKIRKAQEGDKRVVKAVEEPKQLGMKILKDKEYYESPKKEIGSCTFKHLIVQRG